MVGIFNMLSFSELIRRQSGLKGLYTASTTFKRRFLESLGRASFVRIAGFTRVWLKCPFLAVIGSQQRARQEISSFGSRASIQDRFRIEFESRHAWASRNLAKFRLA